MNCTNCGNLIGGNYCEHCGQKAVTARVTLSSVAHDFIHALTHADKGFLLLVRNLVTKPGIVAREYVEGKRKKYFNPLSFLVITSAIHAYISYKTGYFDAMGSNQPRGAGRHMPALWIETFRISNENGKILTLILIVPLMAFLSWIFFRRARYYFAETFVLNSFIVGESHVVRTLIFIPLFLAFPSYANLNVTVFEVILLVYLIVAYRQFFRQNLFLTILKCILTMVLFISLYWAFILAYAYVKHLIIG